MSDFCSVGVWEYIYILGIYIDVYKHSDGHWSKIICVEFDE